MQLIGIMATFSDSWFLADWLSRHHALFEKLVLVDAATDQPHLQLASRLCSQYSSCHHLQQPKLRHVTDQTVRAVAMRVIGNPVDRWIFIAHADEFYTQDPRRIAAWADAMRFNVVRFRQLLVLPTPEEYKNIRAHDWHVEVVETKGGPTRYSPATGEPLSTPMDAPMGTFHPIERLKHYDETATTEERLFKWSHGMHWGKGHSQITPAIFPNKNASSSSNHFYMHFKVHDFGDDAITNNCSYDPRKGGSDSCRFRRSSWSRVHWKNASLGPATYYTGKKRSPMSLDAGIDNLCTKLARGDTLLHCTLPWKLDAYFAHTPGAGRMISR